MPQNVLDCACNGGVVGNAGRCEVAGVVGEAGTCFFVCGKTLLAYLVLVVLDQLTDIVLP